MRPPDKRMHLALATLFGVVAVVFGSTFVKVYPRDFFWVKRAQAEMPVWVRGNINSGNFILYIHGGPGSSGIAEALFEVSPGDGNFNQVSPLRALESEYAVVYWDQRHSGMSRGSADPNRTCMQDFGEDLALVVRELRARYRVRHLFLLGASWGHSVALSYLAQIDSWRENQSGIDGYVIYKANHEAEWPFEAAKPKIVRFAESEIAAGRDVPYWTSALDFYRRTSVLTQLREFTAHDEYATRAMGVSYPLSARAWAAFKASIFTPLNGWQFYLNNRRLMRAERFWSWIISDHSLSNRLSRLTIPVLLIYGERDLIAPPEIGQAIYARVETSPAHKTLSILPNSRHGAEGPDIPRMEQAIRRFIGDVLQTRQDSQGFPPFVSR